MSREKAIEHYRAFMEEIGIDLTNPHCKDTPERVVKMFMEETCSSVNQDPDSIKFTVFPNEGADRVDGVVCTGGCEVRSLCSHHHQFIKGECYIAYHPRRVLVGLSKFNRVVEFFSRKPQTQEILTKQIADYLKKKLDTEDLAVYIRASHGCMEMRGVCCHNSSTKTVELSGIFLREEKARNEFYFNIPNTPSC